MPIFNEEEGNIVEAQMKAISDYRNASVHLGESDEFSFSIIQRCKYYFERMLFFCLDKKSGIRCREDMEGLSYTPNSSVEIKHKIHLLQKRLLLLENK
ncbi:MAG: hypothetical protein ABW189_04490 [Rickettsiales bacterium]